MKLLSCHVENFGKLSDFSYIFEEDLNVHGIAAVAEIYDGDPPYIPHGAINSAMSVAEILRVKYLINQYKDKEESL